MKVDGDVKNPISIILATPFYEVKAYSPYIVSLLGSIRVLEELKIPWEYYELSGDSYVDRAKNTLVDRFLKTTDATHIFMIDSDLYWNVEGFIRIIKAGLMGAEVVGGAYPNKNNWTTFGAVPLMKDGEPVFKEVSGLKLLEMWGIPGGFILYSRKAFERTQPNLNSYYELNHDENFYEYFKMLVQDNKENTTYIQHIKETFDKAVNSFGEYKGAKLDQKFLECFRCSIEENGGRVGEDIYFQQRYREAGGTVWCEPNIHFKHFGVKGWEGNFEEYLNNQKDEPIEDIIERVKSLKKTMKLAAVGE